MNFPPNPMSVQRTTGRQNRGAKEAGGWLKKRETHHTKSKKWNKRLPLPLPNSFVIHPSSSSTSPDGTSLVRHREPTPRRAYHQHQCKCITGEDDPWRRRERSAASRAKTTAAAFGTDSYDDAVGRPRGMFWRER